MLQQIKKSCALNIKSSRLMSILSFSTMTLLILASVVIISILAVLPIIILGIGELGQGQRDIILTPRIDHFNTSHLSQIASVTVMPRIQQMISLKNRQVKGWFMDFKKQHQNHLGKLGGDEPENHNFVYIHEENKAQVGQSIDIALQNSFLLQAIKTAVQSGQLAVQQKQKIYSEIDQLLDNRVTIKGTFIARQIFDTASGKFGIGQVNNYVYMDIKYAFQQMMNHTYQKMKKDTNMSQLIKLLNSPHFSLAHFATEATVNFPNRIAVYSNPNYDQTFITSNQFAKNVLEKAGLFSLVTQLPIAANLTGLGYLGMFMGVMFKLIICSLFILSVLMMNNMFIMAIQSKNFDFALLKVMGADRSFIIANILAGALKYVAYSNLIAYPLAYVALNLITGVFQDFFGYRHEIQPTFGALLGGILIGVLVPIIASVAPLWSVIKNDLAQNLNPLRNKTEGTQVEVYIEGKQFPAGKLAFGLIAASYGLMIYYLLPRALINQNLGLLLAIFFIILQGLLLGLILLSFSVQYALQKMLAYVSLFWVETTDLIMTIKNLQSHRFRNRRTALLYAFSVSFIIYLSVGLQIQLQTVYTQSLKLRGSYIMVYDRDNSLDKQFYDKMLKTVDGVEDWAYVTCSLQKMLPKDTKVLMSDKARINFQNAHIRGVSPNLINTFFYQKVSYYKSYAPAPYDPYSYLYSPQGQNTATVSRYQANQLGLLQGEDREFYINIYQKTHMRNIALNYSTIFDKRMGLLYSRLPSWQQMGVSFDVFKELANLPESEYIRFEELKIKVKDMSRVKQIAEQIRQKNQGANQVWDYTQLKGTIDKIDNILSIVTYILLAISLSISFFSLLTTNYINIINQTNQIATLLILGYQKARITKVYIYQSFIMVLNACLIGLVVGYLTAVMIGLQRQIFSQLPISIQIRGVSMLFLASLLSSLFSTYQPLKKIFNLTISQILNFAK